MIVVVIVLQRRGDRTMTTTIIKGKKGSSRRRNFGLVIGVHFTPYRGDTPRLPGDAEPPIVEPSQKTGQRK
jgi:hypothetical protein